MFEDLDLEDDGKDNQADLDFEVGSDADDSKDFNANELLNLTDY